MTAQNSGHSDVRAWMTATGRKRHFGSVSGKQTLDQFKHVEASISYGRTRDSHVLCLNFQFRQSYDLGS
jgi:hypothetical protein